MASEATISSLWCRKLLLISWVALNQMQHNPPSICYHAYPITFPLLDYGKSSINPG